MKKWLGFLVSLVVLILITYDLMGLMVKNTLSNIINIMPQNSIMSVQIDKFQHGWFSSKALWVFKMHIPAQTITDKKGISQTEPPLDLEMTLPITIKHGPVFFTNDGIYFGMGAITTQPETHYRAFINYLNQIIIKYNLPSFGMHTKTVPNNDELQFNWMGLSALLRLSSNIDNLDSSLKFYGIDGSTNNTVFKIGLITHTFNSKRIQEWLWVGQSHFNISSISVTSNSQNILDLKEFDFILSSDITNETLDFDYKLSLQKLLANNQNYSPAIVKLSLKNLDPEVMAKLNKQIFNMTQNSDPHLVASSIATELPKLLSKGPVLELSEMTINLPEGKIVGHFKISLPQTEEINDLSKAMQQVQGQGYFKAPITIVKELITSSIKSKLKGNQQTEQTSQNPTTLPQSSTNPTSIATDLDEEAKNQANQILQNLVEKGFLKIKDKEYILQFKLENQKIIVNGKLFTPDMLR
ncbi:YdgA family protein [Legionella cincinnatiensis]|uniref:Virulence protein n=1 Tax=Legionella cincinnatiensis TaxID=28085 RepID=A0A378IRC3_9GAMM|nr:YdgA family protein [Legionella cincinnatiensis]KTC91763.1 putative virulence protein [Legionella cincinnatiensis]STX34534.1 putative virulence protein [Legionella cincinnatiensis]